MNRIFRTLLGTSDLRSAGVSRVWHGMRQGDRRELYLGVAMAAVALLRQNQGEKQLIFRKKLPEGTALVIHNRKKGDPKVEVIKP